MALDYKQKTVKSVVKEEKKSSNEEVLTLSGSTVTEEPKTLVAAPADLKAEQKQTAEVYNVPKQVVTTPAVGAKVVNPQPTVTVKADSGLDKVINAYKEKCEEFRNTKNNTIVLYEYFWNIAQYILNAHNRSVYEAFYRKFISDSDLNNNYYALNKIYECKDAKKKTAVCAFFSIFETMRRMLKDKDIVRMSTKAVYKSFPRYPEFGQWLSMKREQR